MARKTLEFLTTADDRDKGKLFYITELPATQAEALAIRAMGAMARAGLELNEETLGGGGGNLAVILGAGLKAFLAAPWEDLQPLLAEIFSCITRIPDASKPDVRRPLIEDDIEEVTTRIRLRDEVIRLHLGFSLADELLRALSAMTDPEGSQITSTSPAP